MRLFIAEKPSMAAEIAKCLPNPVKKNGYYDTGAGKVTWAYGHLLQQADPSEYDPKYKQWTMADLPIIPDQWKLIVSPSCKDQLSIIEQLIKNPDVTELVNAGDPDREGQLLIDEVLEFVYNKKPVKRILLNALDEKSIKRALNDLRNNQEFLTLQQSALARSRADWLIGMNFSRAYTLSAQKAGHQGVLPVGRVKTPTLSLVVRREEEIRNFKPVNYHIVRASFKHQNGAFEAIWQPKDTQSGIDSEGRLIDKEMASELIKKFRSESTLPIITDCVKTQKKETNRLPYSLSALQIACGKRYGYSPQTVLDTAQKLYEKKLTSYPRSDCDYLPDSQFEDAPVILNNLKAIADIELSTWAEAANTEIRSRAWNDKKITAHHAIIPTVVACDLVNLTEEEHNVYWMIAQAYIAQFYPAHVYDSTKIIVEFSKEIFTTSGRAIVEDGWRSLYRKEVNDKKNDEGEDTEESGVLPLVAKNDIVEYMAGYVLDKATTPPSRFTPSTLLEAMKDIHKFVKNPDLKKHLKNVSGIGTEATRATIIKEIIEKGFLYEEKKFLVPSDRAYLLVSLLPDELTYPDSTAEWEMTFNEIVDGNVKLADFIDQQKEFITMLCQKASLMEVKQAQGQTCPSCGQGILRSIKRKNGTGIFWGCNRFPTCEATYQDKKGQPDLDPPLECPECKTGELRQRNGKFGNFWGCTNSSCKATFNDKRGKPIIEFCPNCKTTTLTFVKGTKGPFWSCRKCNTTFNDNKGKPETVKSKKKTS